MIKVVITFQVISPESASHGDFADQGFINEEMTFESKQDALDYFGNSYGYFEQGNETSFYTIDADRCYKTGNETYYGLHFNN